MNFDKFCDTVHLRYDGNAIVNQSPQRDSLWNKDDTCNQLLSEMMNTLIPVISFTLGLISRGAVIIRRGLFFIVLGGGFHSRVGAHRSETKHTNKSRLAHWRGLITNLIHRHLMKDSLRSWRYCVGARLKFWRRSRVPKKGSGDEAAPPSNLTRLYYNGSATKSHSTTTQYRQLCRLNER